MIKYTTTGNEDYFKLRLKNLETEEEVGPYYYDSYDGFYIKPDDLKDIIKLCGQEIFEVKRSKER